VDSKDRDESLMNNCSIARPLAAVALLLALSAARSGALAAECNGNPDALGTGRTIVVDPTEHGRIGTMQYPETLPLRDHEVVLTFDDGPLPPNTNKVLDTLASQCVKATFFIVGRMAHAYPSVLRRAQREGHSIGTHSETHAPKLWKLPVADMQADIDTGINSVGAALGDPNELAPFFRFPGLGHKAEVEANLASRGVMIWSADFPADDWTRIGPKQVLSRALERLERKGRGVLLLHDIHARTVQALPELLAELKKRNYTVVHVVAAGPGQPKTPTEPQDWVLPKPAVTSAVTATAKPKPAAKRSAAAKPATAKPAIAKPAIARPAIAKPATPLTPPAPRAAITPPAPRAQVTPTAAPAGTPQVTRQ
jgi:peptidoglycan/xylan/chitin deacetylase (PgdA/CDA1 family)